ncbi:VanZ family protein [Streptomyces canus]|uniref:VanZ family protein n=1 Tax=Streptomyces canus TaxID=58343 RepID=UPI00277D2D27|nr:VanZ family protein [Streptomyces canus]MDQ0766988.1 hypothetical protein [Streptomyces canus]MDQ1065023.1 hypothetical protein [Streptomyces canus]
MIEASIRAVPGLLVSFLVLASLLCLPTWLAARTGGHPPLVRVLLAASLAGIATVTLLPGNAGDAGTGKCDTGLSLQAALDSPSAWMNVALFVPAVFFAVLAFRRPVTAAAVGMLLSGVIELAQTNLVGGRSCSVTDFAMNTVGALIGAVAGLVWLRARGRGEHRWWRDAAWGTGIACAGLLALAGIVHASSPQTYDAAAVEHRQEAAAKASAGSSEWITGAAQSVFGQGTEVQQIEEIKQNGGLVATATTNRGKLIAWWPQRKLVEAIPKNNQADAGPVRSKQAVRIGSKFAATWFADEIHGARLTTKTLAPEAGDQAMYHLTYRRYVDGVMMPMRLDITVTSSGRVIGFTARPVTDPTLPKAELDRSAAEALVRGRTGKSPTAAVLLAQKVAGAWRPVWMVGMPEGSKTPDMFVDAVTGRKVTPQMS